MGRRKYILLGDQKRAAGMLPFAYRLADSLAAQDRRHARREMLDGTWVEVTRYSASGLEDIRIFGGSGYGAGSYIVVEADYVRDGVDTIWGSPLGTQPGYRNYFVYAVDGYTAKTNLLFWFYGGDSPMSSAIGSRGASTPPPIIYPYFFNNAFEGNGGLLHLHVDNHYSNTTGGMYAEYLFVSDTRDFGSYTATVEGWQIWVGFGEATWPVTVYDGTLLGHIFLPPAQRMAANQIRGDETWTWSYNIKTQESDTPDWTPLIGYKIANTNYYGYTSNFWNTWVDFNNGSHFPYAIYNPDGAGTDGYDIYGRSDDSIIRALNDIAYDMISFFNWREVKLFCALDYRIGATEAYGDIGLFSVDIVDSIGDVGAHLAGFCVCPRCHFIYM